MNLYDYQNELLEIYMYVRDIFLKYDIKSIAHSGTLLGIIRHNNDFIPWDDDLDILVPYDKLKLNYKSISNKINGESGKYWIFNFIEHDPIIKNDIFMLRVYKRDKILLESENDELLTRPFIDIFAGIPNNTFKTRIGWKIYSWHHQMFWITRKGFKRFNGTVNNKKRSLIKNFVTYPIKIFFWANKEEKKILDTYNNNDGNWNIIHRADCWAYRDINYNLNNLIKTNIRGEEIWINKDFKRELLKSYGNDWDVIKRTHNHTFSNKHIYHKRNININNFLDNLDHKIN